MTDTPPLSTLAAQLAADTAAVDDRALAALGQDDIGNAERFIAREGENVRETQRLGALVWDGVCWRDDDGGVRLRLKAQRVARAIEGEARTLFAVAEQAKKDGDEPAEGAARAQAKSLYAWARQSANQQRLAAMVTQALPHLNVPLETWNAAPGLLTLQNGVLDFDTPNALPTLRPHRRDAYLTRCADVAYQYGVECPAWRAFTETILPDEEVRWFVQRALGACLVDSAGDQAIVVAHGAGANGKSTLFDVVSSVLGDYAVAVNVKSFLADDRANGASPQPDLVRLALKPRLIRTSEPPPGARLAEGVLKEFTGGEPIVARDLHQKPLEFAVVGKIFLSCNTRPSVRGGDDGIWRRILLAPFTVQIPADQRDPHLKRRLLQERAGILNWLVEGWRDWRDHGLSPPSVVLQASAEYRTDSDSVGRFLGECSARADAAETDGRALRRAYEGWCKAEQIEPLSGQLLGLRLNDRGYRKRKSAGRVFYLGLALTEYGQRLADEREFDELERASRGPRGRASAARDDGGEE